MMPFGVDFPKDCYDVILHIEANNPIYSSSKNNVEM